MPDRAKRAERLMAIRLRYMISTHLDDRGITAAPDIARAVGLPDAEAAVLREAEASERGLQAEHGGAS